MKILSIVGARPQFVKVAPLARACEKAKQDWGISVDHRIVHTGQHYDVEMSDIFFEELDIPRPHFNLEVGSGRHGAQTGQMLDKIEQIFMETESDLVVLYGDTNSTLAGALGAAKLGIPIAHVEAGVRSFNRTMPEEINRLVADHVSDLLLAPTVTAVDNLVREGLESKTVLTGDIMCDALLYYLPRLDEQLAILEILNLHPKQYAVVTLHRAENTNQPERLWTVLQTLEEIAETEFPIIFPIHPRTKTLIHTHFPDWTPSPQLQMISPVGYLDMLRLVRHARLTLTDSGGLQKEAFLLGCPCITLREETEWVETVASGGNILTGVNSQQIFDAVQKWNETIKVGGSFVGDDSSAVFGGGNAADRILKEVIEFHQLV